MKSVVANDRTERKHVDDEEEEAEQQSLLVLTKVELYCLTFSTVQNIHQNMDGVLKQEVKLSVHSGKRFLNEQHKTVLLD